MTAEILDGDALATLRTLPDEHFHCVVTSPPYWGLRDYGVEGQLGLEPTPEDFVERMVEVFAEVRRVLRRDGTLWLNIGDSYCHDTKWGGRSGPINEGKGYRRPNGRRETGRKPKDLIGVPWLLAFALQRDGWWLRSEIIWHKKAPMPESVSDRPTKTHEQVFLFTRSPRYFYDSIASAEPVTGGAHARGNGVNPKAASIDPGDHHNRPKQNPSFSAAVADLVADRNMRTVWTLGPEGYDGAHFATMPTELARRCLLAGTSERGCCPACGEPYQRQVARERKATRDPKQSKLVDGPIKVGTVKSPIHHDSDVVGNRDPYRHVTTRETVGWTLRCKCEASEPLPSIPCRVLDPFSGAGTTGVVARRLQLSYVGIELNPEYAADSRERIRDDAPLFNEVA